MIADQEWVQQFTLPELPADIRETLYQEEQLAGTIDLYLQAHEASRQALTEQERDVSRARDTRYITGIYALERTRETWIGLEHPSTSVLERIEPIFAR